LPTREDAEDLLHDTILQALESYTSLERIESFSAWFTKIAKNRVVDFYRKKKPVPESSLLRTGDADAEPVMLADIIPGEAYEPEQMLLRDRIWNEIQAGLDALPVEQREAFVCNEFEGESFREMEIRTNVPMNTLLARKRYAVLSLRKRLLPVYNELFVEKN